MSAKLLAEIKQAQRKNVEREFQLIPFTEVEEDILKYIDNPSILKSMDASVADLRPDDLMRFREALVQHLPDLGPKIIQERDMDIAFEQANINNFKRNPFFMIVEQIKSYSDPANHDGPRLLEGLEAAVRQHRPNDLQAFFFAKDAIANYDADNDEYLDGLNILEEDNY